MRNCRYLAILGALFLALPCLLMGSQPIEPVSAQPIGITVGTPQSVLFTAFVGQDPSLIVSSINLIRYTNNQSSVVATMYDDGTHGDSVPGDGVFSTVISLYAAAPADMSFAVSAAYRGVLRRILSDPITLHAFVPPTSNDVQTQVNSDSSAWATYNSSLLVSSPTVAKAQTVAYMQSLPNVLGAGLSVDGNTIWIEYEGGLKSFLFVGPPDTRGGPNRVPRVSGFPLWSAMVALATSMASQPSSENALVLAPFWSVFGGAAGDPSEWISAKLRQINANVTLLENEQVTVDAISQLAKYSLISWTGHGGIDASVSPAKVMLSTGEIFTPQKAVSQPYVSEIKAGLISRCSHDSETFYFCINSDFVSNNSKTPSHPNGFPNTIVVMDACDTFAQPDLERAFLNNGASSYLGWNASVSTTFGATEMMSLFGNLTTPVNGSFSTVRSSYDALSTTIDPIGGQEAQFLLGQRQTDRSLIGYYQPAGQTTYIYNGPHFTYISGNPGVGTSNHITFSMTFAAPLPPNLYNQAVTLSSII